MKKILLISTNADEAGAPRHVETVVNELRVKFVFYAIFGESGPVSERIKSLGIDVNIVPTMRSEIDLFRDYKSVLEVYRIIKLIQPDLIHCHSAKASFIARICGFLSGIQVIYTVHGWGWRGKRALPAMLIYLIEFILARLVKTKYIYVAAAVERQARSLLLIPKKRGNVIYNGVSQILLGGVPSRNGALRFLMPARVSSAKDHLTLFKAFEMLDANGFELTLCGLGTDDMGFIDFAKMVAPTASRNFIFLGQRSDIDELYSQADVVLLISKFEALPLTIIEAMSCGKAVIATDTGGVSELISNNETGLLVGRESVQDLTAALHSVFDANNRERLGYNAKKCYEEKFSSNSMAANLASVYSES